LKYESIRGGIAFCWLYLDHVMVFLVGFGIIIWLGNTWPFVLLDYSLVSILFLVGNLDIS